MGSVKKIGVLGGTFDPLHIGHILMAQTVYEAMELDRVLFVPAGLPPHKRKEPHTDIMLRLEMIRASIIGDERFEVSAVDAERPGPHYSADMLSILRQQYSLSCDDLYFILGSDSLAQLSTWYMPERIVTEAQLVVLTREGFPVDCDAVYSKVPAAIGRIHLVEMPFVAISSTKLREMAARGRSIRYWVPDAAAKIVAMQRLYSNLELGPIKR